MDAKNSGDNFEIRFKDESGTGIFKGETLNGAPHGKGEVIYEKHPYFKSIDGFFRHGRPRYGEIKLLSGDVFKGKIKRILNNILLEGVIKGDGFLSAGTFDCNGCPIFSFIAQNTITKEINMYRMFDEEAMEADCIGTVQEYIEKIKNEITTDIDIDEDDVEEKIYKINKYKKLLELQIKESEMSELREIQRTAMEKEIEEIKKQLISSKNDTNYDVKNDIVDSKEIEKQMSYLDKNTNASLNEELTNNALTDEKNLDEPTIVDSSEIEKRLIQLQEDAAELSSEDDKEDKEIQNKVDKTEERNKVRKNENLEIMAERKAINEMKQKIKTEENKKLKKQQEESLLTMQLASKERRKKREERESLELDRLIKEQEEKIAFNEAHNLKYLEKQAKKYKKEQEQAALIERQKKEEQKIKDAINKERSEVSKEVNDKIAKREEVEAEIPYELRKRVVNDYDYLDKKNEIFTRYKDSSYIIGNTKLDKKDELVGIAFDGKSYQIGTFIKTDREKFDGYLLAKGILIPINPWDGALYKIGKFDQLTKKSKNQMSAFVAACSNKKTFDMTMEILKDSDNLRVTRGEALLKARSLHFDKNYITYLGQEKEEYDLIKKENKACIFFMFYRGDYAIEGNNFIKNGFGISFKGRYFGNTNEGLNDIVFEIGNYNKNGVKYTTLFKVNGESETRAFIPGSVSFAIRPTQYFIDWIEGIVDAGMRAAEKTRRELDDEKALQRKDETRKPTESKEVKIGTQVTELKIEKTDVEKAAERMLELKGKEPLTKKEKQELNKLEKEKKERDEFLKSMLEEDPKKNQKTKKQPFYCRARRRAKRRLQA